LNFLAHFYLTRHHAELTVGNFLADFVRGSIQNQFSQKVNEGIRIHRQIDSFTDSHPVVQASRQRLRSTYHKYAMVITDVYYDHLLALHWNSFSEIPLEKFSAGIYDTLKQHQEIFPERAKNTFHYMHLHDWLTSYRTLEGIEHALYGLSRRATFESGMENATADLKRDFTFYEKEFLLFFPQLIQHCATKPALQKIL
jgi:acyl carrier protein phosphodiesterase